MITQGKAILNRLLLISFAAMLLSFGPSASNAQSTVEQRVDARLKVWTERMKLTEDQQTKVKDLLLERERQWDADHAKVLAAGPADRARLRDEQREHMQSYRDKLHNVLTPEQQKIAKNLREMRRTNPRSGRGNGAGLGARNGTGATNGTGPRNGTGRRRGQN